MSRKKKQSSEKTDRIVFSERLALSPERQTRIKRAAAVLLAGGILAAVVVEGFGFLEDYVAHITGRREVQWRVQLVDPPRWVSEELRDYLCLETCGIESGDFLLDKHLTRKWAANLAKNPWVKHIRQVRKRYDGLVEIDCELRQPIASIKQGSEVYYLDVEGVILPVLPLEGTLGHVVCLRGESAGQIVPGDSIDSAAILAGIEVLAMIRQVDEQLPRAERLWHELASLDVANYEGRKDSAQAHLKLYTKNNHTEVRWGAAVDRSRVYYEAPEKYKVERLYQAHRLYGTLDRFEYIELRDMRKERADPLRQG